MDNLEAQISFKKKTGNVPTRFFLSYVDDRALQNINLEWVMENCTNLRNITQLLESVAYSLYIDDLFQANLYKYPYFYSLKSLGPKCL